MANVKGRATPIQLPAPAATTVLITVCIATEANHPGAADQGNSGLVGEGSMQRGAFIAGDQALLGG